jgi:hypothetical protein
MMDDVVTVEGFPPSQFESVTTFMEGSPSLQVVDSSPSGIVLFFKSADDHDEIVERLNADLLKKFGSKLKAKTIAMGAALFGSLRKMGGKLDRLLAINEEPALSKDAACASCVRLALWIRWTRRLHRSRWRCWWSWIRASSMEMFHTQSIICGSWRRCTE